MDRILIILKEENGPRASSAPALGLNTIIFKHVYWYMQQTQVSVYRTIGPLVYYWGKKVLSIEYAPFCLCYEHHLHNFAVTITYPTSGSGELHSHRERLGGGALGLAQGTCYPVSGDIP